MLSPVALVLVDYVDGRFQDKKVGVLALVAVEDFAHILDLAHDDLHV
jgi:hypothetical protein